MSDKTVKVEIIKDVEGRSVYIDDYRVAGSKPWGGGTVIDSFETSIKDFLRALDICPVRKISKLEKENAELRAEIDKRDDLLRDAIDILNSVDSSECGCIDRKIWIDCEKLDITVKKLTQETDEKK